MKVKAVIVAGLLMVGVEAGAATLQGGPDCGFFAQQVGILGQQRDQGRSWEEVKAWLEESLKAAYKAPDTIVNDEDDVRYIRSVVESVWKGPLRNLSGHELVLKVLNDCRKKPV